MNLSPKLHSLLAKPKAYNFHLQTLKRPVAFSAVHYATAANSAVSTAVDRCFVLTSQNKTKINGRLMLAK